MIKSMLFVFIGGGAGSMMRYVASVFGQRFSVTAFPLSTLSVNVVGCLLMGLLTGMFAKNHLAGADAKLLLITGFCGGFTTFSAFAQENLNLMQTNQTTLAIMYTGLSILLGPACVWAGLLISR
jgi:CrcB protein